MYSLIHQVDLNEYGHGHEPCYMNKPKTLKTTEGIENKQRLQTLSIDTAWSNKNFLFYLTFRMLQHTSSEVNGYNCYKHF